MPHNTMLEPETLTIKEMAAESGLSEYTLRYYEKIGLIQPIPRDRSSGHRRYAPETAERLESLACLRATGLSIEDMRAYFANLSRGDEAAKDQIALFQAHETEIAREIERLEIRRRFLDGKIAYWKARENGDAQLIEQIMKKNQEIAKLLYK